MGDIGLRYLVDVLRTNKRITQLNISQNEIIVIE
ncbi:unnamed protein product, partial [Adineta steineri]